MKELSNIMMIEDDPDIQEAGRLALESIGEFSLTICSSGEAAINIVGEVKPQLILLDVQMPHMDGPTTLKELKKFPEAAAIPIIFLTANVQPHEVAAYKNMGVIEVISKPFNPTTLAETILTIWKNQE